MARLHEMSTIVLLVLFSLRLSLSADPPEGAPTPAPKIDGDTLSPLSGSRAPESPSQLSGFGSPPTPPSLDVVPTSSPMPLPADSPSKKSPTPARADGTKNSDLYPYVEEANESSSGMKGRRKSGIVVGVIAGICLVGLRRMVYKKR